MPKIKQCSIQLGKQGITDNFIDSMKKMFQTHENVKVCILKNAGHDKKKVKQFTGDILQKFGPKYTTKIIGFTIFVKKWKKEKW